MKRTEVGGYCLSLSGVQEYAPFKRGDTVIYRHWANKKWFALTFSLKGREGLNIKLSPMENDFFRLQYRGIEPGWHMNKTHWSTIWLDSDAGKNKIERLIDMSYSLTKPKSLKL